MLNAHQNGEDEFQEFVAKLDRFIRPENITLGRARGFGHFADVHEADMRVPDTGVTMKAAVKRFRVHLKTEAAFAKSFKREVLIWKQLEHENILQLLGITLIDGIPSTVSEWMENGTMDKYLESHPNADVFMLVNGVACGLEYLHAHGVVHSDLKSDNVLISSDGCPLLSDFGISRLQANSITVTGTTTLRGNTRWMAPELIQAPIESPNQMHTLASDVWAFGMVAYHTLSGRIPYYEYSREIQVVVAVTEGKLPTAPAKVLDDWNCLQIWMCCRECWSSDPASRPTMSDVRKRLKSKDAFQETVKNANCFIQSNDINIGRERGSSGFTKLFDAEMHCAETVNLRKVAVKRFQVVFGTAFSRSLKREVLTRNHLDHRNVLPLLGITLIDGGLCTVSEWMANGTMCAYLECHPDADILKLLKGIACGLEYLHGREIVHSNLMSNNVLISPDGLPVLTDFWISRLQVDSTTTDAGKVSLGGNARWMAPELIGTRRGSGNLTHTKEADVWAFGMVAYDATCGKIPFHDCSDDAQVMTEITAKRLPTRPVKRRVHRSEFHAIWNICCDCWSYVSTLRPTITLVRKRLKFSTISLEVKTVTTVPSVRCWMSPMGRFFATTSSDWRSLSFTDLKTKTRYGIELELDSKVDDVAWSSSEEHIVIRFVNGLLQMWTNLSQTPTKVAQATQAHKYAVVQFSPDDRFIASFNQDTVILWDTSNFTPVWQAWGCCESISFHPSGNRLFLFNGNAVANVNFENTKAIIVTKRETIHIDFIDLVIFDNSGNICIARTDEGIKILDANTFQEKSSLPYRYYETQMMQITPDEKYVLLVLWSRKVILWDIVAGETVKELTLDVSPYWNAQVSKCCDILTLCGDDLVYIIDFLSMYH